MPRAHKAAADSAEEASGAQIAVSGSTYSAAIRNGTALDKKPDEFPQYVPTKFLKSLSGLDIQRKSTLRKAKFLFSLPGNLSSVKGGKIGEISGMDTSNPVIHMDFPTGRLRLQGTVVKPATTKYMTLACSKPTKAGSKGSVVCEDIFTAVVVFSTAVWEASEELPADKRGEGGIPLDILQAAFPSKTFAGSCSRPAKPSSDPSVSQSQSQAGSASGSKPAEESQGSDQPSQEYRTSSGRRARRAAPSMAEEALADSLGESGHDDSSDSSAQQDSDDDVQEVMVRRVGVIGEGGVEGRGGADQGGSPGAAGANRTVWGTLSDLDSDIEADEAVSRKPRRPPSRGAAVSDSSSVGSDHADDSDGVQVLDSESARDASDESDEGSARQSASKGIGSSARKSVKRGREKASAATSSRKSARPALKRSGTATTTGTQSASVSEGSSQDGGHSDSSSDEDWT